MHMLNGKNDTKQRLQVSSTNHYSAHTNRSFLVLSIILVLLGQVVTTLFLMSAQSDGADVFLRHALFTLMGLLILWMVSRMDTWFLRRIIPAFYLCILVLNLLFCLDIQNAFISSSGHSLRFGESFSIEVTQTLIIATCLMLALLLSSKQSFAMNIITLCAVVAPISLMFLSHRIDGAVILLLIAMTLALLRWKLSMLILAGAVSGAAAFWAYTKIAYSNALIAWMDPFSDPMGSGYQIIQSLYAIASGGTLGMGSSSQTAALLLGNNDTFILAGIIHQHGIAIAVICCLVFALFFLEACKIVLRTTNRFYFYLSATIVIRLLVLVSLNFMVISNLLPEVSGYLPFFTISGTSLLFDCLMLGILLNISRTENQN